MNKHANCKLSIVCTGLYFIKKDNPIYLTMMSFKWILFMFTLLLLLLLFMHFTLNFCGFIQIGSKARTKEESSGKITKILCCREFEDHLNALL